MENNLNTLNNEDFLEIIYNDFYLIKNNIIYNIHIEKTKNSIIIKSNNYIGIYDLNNLSNLLKIRFYSIDTAYDYIINLFEENKVMIKSKIINKKIILIFNSDYVKNIELILLYNEDCNNIIVSEINKLKKDINDLKKVNKQLTNEIHNLKKIDKNQNPKGIKLSQTVSTDSYADYGLDNTFTIFKSINNLLYLIYSTKNCSIIGYNLNTNNKTIEIKNCHNKYITNFRHYLDEINRKDFILSISNEDNNIKLWDIKNWECVLNIQNVNNKGYLYSACFLKEGNNNYIISSNYNEIESSENIKIFDFKGEKKMEIEHSNEITFLVDIYHEKYLDKNFIITGNLNYVKSYDYNNAGQLYHKYFDNGNGYHFSINIYKDNNIIKLIESCEDGNIRIWHFHSGLLLRKIKISIDNLNGLCLWNENYLFVGCDDNTIKLIDLKNEIIIEEIKGHNKEVLTIKKINNGNNDLLISQGYEDDQIRIWNL